MPGRSNHPTDPRKSYTLPLVMLAGLLLVLTIAILLIPTSAFAKLLYPTEGSIRSAEGSLQIRFQSASAIVSDGQFVWGPNVGDFDVEDFLKELDSTLAPYAKSIESWARYYTINPRVVLALLESNYSFISNLDSSINPGTVHQMIEKTSADLSLAFYQHMYELGTCLLYTSPSPRDKS